MKKTQSEPSDFRTSIFLNKILSIDFGELGMYENRMIKTADRTKAERIDFVASGCGRVNALSAG